MTAIFSRASAQHNTTFACTLSACVQRGARAPVCACGSVSLVRLRWQRRLRAITPTGPPAARMRMHSQPKQGPHWGSRSGLSWFVGSKCSLPGIHLTPQWQKPPSRGIGGNGRVSVTRIANAPASACAACNTLAAARSFGTAYGNAPRHTGPSPCTSSALPAAARARGARARGAAAGAAARTSSPPVAIAPRTAAAASSVSPARAPGGPAPAPIGSPALAKKA